MKNLTWIVGLTAALALAPACGDDDDGGTIDAPPSNTIDAPPTGDIDAPPTVDVTCESYCATITASCTDANAQYADEAECNTMCDAAAWDVGTAEDTSGDTLGCRLYHAGAAASTGMPDVHCPHAGATSVNADGTPGPCSEPAAAVTCADYCTAITAACMGDDAQYADEAECNTMCDAAGWDPGTAEDTAGDTIGCRLYHANAAAAAAGDADTVTLHCGHAAAMSVEADGTTAGPCSAE